MSHITLKELIIAVKEQNLTKDQLETYRDQLSSLYAEMQLEIANLEKIKAVFFVEMEKGEKTSDIYIKRQWNARPSGMREIELKRYCLATKELLNSLKSRLYSIY